MYSSYIYQGILLTDLPISTTNEPNLREILKEEIQKLLNAGFIYPISDSEWVSPLVIVPKKSGKWRVCLDYRALNKATKKDHFPLPFID